MWKNSKAHESANNAARVVIETCGEKTDTYMNFHDVMEKAEKHMKGIT
jgi:hypothetical protein